MMKKAKVLLVEDDPSLGFVLKDNLMLRGYDVVLCADGDAGEKMFAQQPVDLCILDVMLPKQDGFTLGKKIRSNNAHVPILYLTAKSMTEDKLEGFKQGGDDYITKPFNIDELVLRMEVFLRRPLVNAEEQPVMAVGGFQFDHKNLLLSHASGSAKTLTTKECEVLKMLFQNRDRVLKREEILTKVWGNDDYFMGRSMDVFISKLRKYLKDDPTIEIVNYHGVGFKLEVKA
jgi:DNA-binding response OmpR family regulator